MVARSWLAGGLLAMMFSATTLLAAERPKLEGVFVREVGDTKVQFTFKPAGLLKVTLTDANGQSVEVTSEYTLARDHATVYGVVTEKQGEQGPEIGTPFSFKVSMKPKELAISDLHGPDTDNARPIIEGDYQLTTP